MAECILGQAIEWNALVWIISIDLQKVFDRIEYKALFSALSEQGVGDSYFSLLERLYSNQSGNVANECKLLVTRGVRQSNVFNFLLFNAALENVISKWKMHRLTNLRYADDLLLFGKSLAEVLEMLEILSAELVGVGLSINGSKTKILTTDLNASSSENPLYVDIAGSMVEVLRRGTVHKYLGKAFCGNLRNRGQCNLSHRMQCAWWKFHELRTTLENKNIPLKLRLKLFDAVVSPTILYSLSTTPLTSA